MTDDEVKISARQHEEARKTRPFDVTKSVLASGLTYDAPVATGLRCDKTKSFVNILDHDQSKTPKPVSRPVSANNVIVPPDYRDTTPNRSIRNAG